MDIDKYQKSKLAFEYRPEVMSAFLSINHYPDKFILMFLEILENDPKIDIEVLLENVNKEYNKWLMPYDNEELNLAINEARKLGTEAEAEYIKVIEVLGNSVQLEVLIEKLKGKYAGTKHNDSDNSKDKDVKYFLKKYNSSLVDLMEKLNIKYNKSTNTYTFNDECFETLLPAIVKADMFESGVTEKDITGHPNIDSFLLHLSRKSEHVDEESNQGLVKSRRAKNNAENIKTSTKINRGFSGISSLTSEPHSDD